jgi:hypothetical protein
MKRVRIVAVDVVAVGMIGGLVGQEGCRWRLEAVSLSSLFLVDMIPVVSSIVVGLDGTTMVQYPLL